MQSVRVSALLWGGFACPVSASLASATVRRVLLLRLAELQTPQEMIKLGAQRLNLKNGAWPQQPLPLFVLTLQAVRACALPPLPLPLPCSGQRYAALR